MVINISDIRKINLSLKNRIDIDLSEYAFFFYKRILENIIQKNNFKSVDEFINYIYDYEQFTESLKEELLVPETEMFRDPSMWEFLRKIILPKLSTKAPYSILLPEVSTGEELYTLLILLHESGFLHKVNIVVSSSSDNHLKRIKKGIFIKKDFENNEANYKRYNGNSLLSNYLIQERNKIYFDEKILKNVKFIHQNLIKINNIENLNLILFRNKIIYYNTLKQNRILRHLSMQLENGGFIVLGAKENIDSYLIDLNFSEVNKFESIFKKMVRK